MKTYDAIIMAYPERPFQVMIISENSPTSDLPHTTVETFTCTLDQLNRTIMNKIQQYSLGSVTLYGPETYIYGRPFLGLEEKVKNTKMTKFVFCSYQKGKFDEE